MANRAHPNVCPAQCYPLLIILAFFVMMSTLFMYNETAAPRPYKYTKSEFHQLNPYIDLNNYKVKTYKGMISLEELNENVFKKFGYEIIRPTSPVPTLRMIQEPTCDTVFSEWLRISEEPQPIYPPKEIPPERLNEFLLNNYTAINKWYINDKNSEKGEKPRNWDNLSKLIKLSRESLGGLAYGQSGVSMYDAMKFYGLKGKNGLVVGSMQPWVEVSALVHGAAKILTVEYNKLTIQEEFRDRLSSILPSDFVKNWQTYEGTFDFAASFSSIEHSGLGRYGDPIDPIGDIREILKIRCLLKKGGLLFLGFPLGTDSIQYNAHRIYGPVRLAMMFFGFEWLNTFSGNSEQPNDLTSERLHQSPIFEHVQDTVVLRKL